VNCSSQVHGSNRTQNDAKPSSSGAATSITNLFSSKETLPNNNKFTSHASSELDSLAQNSKAMCDIDKVEVLIQDNNAKPGQDNNNLIEMVKNQAEHLQKKQKILVQETKPDLNNDDNFDEIIKLKEMLERKSKDFQNNEINLEEDPGQ